MHPEIEAALAVTRIYPELPALNCTTMQNAARLLDYIEDLNLERNGKFVPTMTKSLYMQWNVAGWECHMECAHDGSIFYSFCSPDEEPVTGNNTVPVFLTKLETFLLEHVG